MFPRRATSAGLVQASHALASESDTPLRCSARCAVHRTGYVAGPVAVCDKQHVANQPHATWVNDPADAVSALKDLYADAACLGTTTVSGTGTLSVTIPQIASAAAISVDRVNPAIGVTFVQPDGTQWTDASAISGAGTNSADEVLHLDNITDADVGPWTVKLTAPAANVDPAVLDALLYPYVTPPTVQLVLHTERARAVWPLVSAETFALTVETPLWSVALAYTM